MARLARDMGVPAACILTERDARTTYESARNCAALMRRHGWTSVLLVTDGWHLARGLLAFRGFGVTAQGESAGGGPGEVGYRRWLAYAAREALAMPWYSLRLRGRLLRVAGPSPAPNSDPTDPTGFFHQD